MEQSPSGRTWHRLRWLILGLWAALLIAAAPLALHVAHGLSSSGFEDPRSQAAWADAQLRRLPHGAPGGASTLVRGATAAAVQALWAQAAAAAGVPVTAAHIVALPGHPDAVSVDVLPGAGAAGATAAHALVAAASRLPGASVRPVDLGSAGDGVVTAATQTLKVAGYVALPALAVLLLLVYDSVVAALLPLVVAVAGSVLALAVVDLLEPHMTLSIYLTNIVSFLALGVGIDYSLFLSARFRGALRDGVPVTGAIAVAMRTAGRSVFFSALAVGASMLTLLIPRTAYWSGLAIGGCVAVLAVLVATLTLLPALLAILGTQSERGRIPRPRAVAGIWDRVAHALTRRPVLVLAVGIALLGLPAAWAGAISVRSPANVSLMLPRDSVLRLAIAQQQQDYGPGSIAPLPIALRSPTPLTDPATWSVVGALTERVRALPGAASVDSPTATGVAPAALAAAFAAPGGPPAGLRGATAAPDLIALAVTSKYAPDDERTVALLAGIQDALHSGLPSGWRGGVGGAVALLGSFNTLVAQTLPVVVAAVAAVALVVLFAATGSLWVSLLAVAFDGLVALATAGLLVLTVQQGRLGFEALPLDSSITPLIFVILFGLSMDYEVILIHRIREYAAAGIRPGEAARRGLGETGGMITGAGLIMVVVFAAMLLSSLQIMRTLAIGMSVAILLDTWIVRTALVPTSVALLGRWGWWPSKVGAAPAATLEGRAAD